MKREFINCDCHTEGLVIDEVDGDIYIALWAYGQHGKQITFLDRLRWCWNIMIKGLPWVDCVILHKEETKKLASILYNHLIKITK